MRPVRPTTIAPMHVPTPQTSAEQLRIGIVVSRYHDAITSALLAGATDAFARAGGDASEDLVVLGAPGTFELPVIAARLAHGGSVDAVVVLGCVVTGETRHDEYLASAVANACAAVAIETGVPVAFGVLTVANLDQARERSGGSKGNKGAEAMVAAIEASHAIEAADLEGERFERLVENDLDDDGLEDGDSGTWGEDDR